ncbi:type II toxin-antitoxin system YoeB family toxin, partial [Bacteroides cellulosilyticus]
MYEIEFSKEAAKHLLLLRKSSPQLFKKLERLLDELKEHPYTGTGHPEQLKGLQLFGIEQVFHLTKFF